MLKLVGAAAPQSVTGRFTI